MTPTADATVTNPAAPTALPLRSLWFDVANGACFLAIAWMVISPAFGPPASRAADHPGRFGDHSINESLSLMIDADRDYPGGFTYPPPSVVTRIALHRMCGENSGWIWISWLVVATLACFPLLYRLLEIDRHPLRNAVGLIAFLTCRYYFGYDLHSANCNAMALALTLASLLLLERRRPGIAGALVAAAVALKLYSAALLLYWIWKRQWRVVAWSTGWLLLLFTAAPAICWGPSDALVVTTSWLQEVRHSGESGFSQRFVAYLVSVDRTTSNLSRHESIATNNAFLQARTWLPLGVKLLWITMLLGYIAASFRSGATDSPRTRFADACAVFIAPLPLSPLLQPHHLVVVLPSHALFAALAFEVFSRTPFSYPTAWRILTPCVVVLIGSVLAIECGPTGDIRGLAVLLHLVLLLSGLAWFQWAKPALGFKNSRCGT